MSKKKQPEVINNKSKMEKGPVMSEERIRGHIPGLTYEHRIQPRLDLIEGWARNGLSIAEIAHNLGYTDHGFRHYLTGPNAREDLIEALDRGKFDADIIVENAFYKRCIGYNYWEIERERRREIDEDGNWTGRFKMVTVRRINKHVPGDTGAAYKWLQKRMPDRWGEQRESVYSETDQDGFLAALALSVGEAWADEGGEEDGDEESEE